MPVIGPEVDKMRQEYAFFAPDTIPANTYKGVGRSEDDRSRRAMGDVAKQPDATIYEVTKALWNEIRASFWMPAMPKAGPSREQRDAWCRHSVSSGRRAVLQGKGHAEVTRKRMQPYR